MRVYLLLLGLLLISISAIKAQTQQIEYEMKLLRVYQNYPHNDPGGPDITWRARATLNGLGAPMVFPTAQIHLENMQDTGWTNIVDQTIAQGTMTFTTGNTFNLCNDNISVNLELEAWEDDCGNVFEFSQSCDDHRFGANAIGRGNPKINEGSGVTRIFELKNFNPNNFQNPYYGFEVSLTYILTNGIREVIFAGDINGGPIVDVCEGGSYFIFARTQPGFSGGDFEFQRSNDNGASWNTVQTGNLSTYQVTADADPNILYRVRLRGGFGCLGYTNDEGWVTPASSSNLNIIPTFGAADIDYAVESSCEGPATSSITVSNIDNIPPGTNVTMLLSDVNEPNIVLPAAINVPLPYTWTDLAPGNYKLQVTGIQINNNNLPTGQCTQDIFIEIPPVTLPVFTSVIPSSPGCEETTGLVNITINTFTSAFSYSWEVFEVGNTSTPVAASNQQISSLQITNLMPGDYYVRLTINGNCELDSDPFTIEAPPASAGGTVQVIYPGAATDVQCPDGRATINLSASAGTGQNIVRVYLANALNNQIDSGTSSPGSPYSTLLSPGSYTAVFQREDNGCQAFVNFNIANPNNVLTAIVQATQAPPSCTPLGGSLTLNVSGGAAPYTFVINGSVRNPTSVNGNNRLFNQLPSGIGTYEVIDANGCTTDISYFTIGRLPFPAFSISFGTDDFMICNGDTDLNFLPIYLGNFNSTSTYQFRVDPLQSTYGPALSPPFNGTNFVQPDLTATNLPPGSYTVFMRENPSGCEVARMVVVEEIPEMVITRVEAEPVYCQQNNTEVKIYVSGIVTRTFNNRPWQNRVRYSILGGTNWSSANMAIDPNSPNSIIITLPSANVFTPLNIIVQQDRGRVWTSTTSFFPEGINIEGGNCSTPIFSFPTSNFNIAPPVMVATQLTSPTCPGETNGSITVNFTGGEPGYELELVRFGTLSPPANPTVVQTVLLSGNAPGAYTFTGLSAGSYGVQVRTALVDGGASNLPGSCTRYFPGNWTIGQSFTPYTLTNPSAVNINIINTTTPLQCDLTGGQITVQSVTGGTLPYQYSINGVDFSASNVLPALRENTVYVRDANFCQITQSYTVTDIVTSDLTMSFEATPPSNCILQGLGTFTINPGTLGTPPYRIEYASSMSGGQLVNPVIIQTSNLSLPVSGLSPGNLFVNITDGAQCTKSFTFTVNNVSASPLTAGTTSKTQQSCPEINKGALTITVQGGISPYQILYNGVSTTGSSLSLSNLGPGTYFFDITDAAGCTYTHEESIEAATVIRHDQSYIAIGPCADSGNGSVTITPQGGLAPYTISWQDGTPDQIAGSGGSITRTNLDREEYTFTITGVGGCFLVSSIYPPGPDELFEAELSTVSPPLCAGVNDGSVTVQATGGILPYTYSIDGGISFQNSATFSSLSAGTYSVIAKDDLGCERIIQNIQINNIATINVDISTVPIPCFGESSGSITVIPTGGTGSFTLSVNGSTPSMNLTAGNLSGGTYTIEVRDGNGCLFSDDDVVIAQPDMLDLVATPTPPACNGNSGSISLSSSGGTGSYEYRLVGGTYSANNIISNLVAGFYDVQVRDANGCETTLINVGLTEPPVIDIQLEDTTPEFCSRADGTATVSATGGTGTLSYIWSNGDTGPTVNDLSEGNAIVTVTDQNNCMNTLAVNIVGVPFPVITDIEVQNAICIDDNGSAELSFTGGTGAITINWSNGASGTILTGLSSGTYTATLTDAVGCSVIQSTIVGFLPAHTLTTIQSDENCDQANGSITVNTSGGSGDFTFSWPAGVTATGNMAENLSGGTYTITVTDNVQGCVVTSTVVLDNTLALIATFETTGALCNGLPSGTITAIPTTGTAPYSISINGGTPIPGLTVSGLTAGTYAVLISDVNGCELNDPAVVVNEPNVLTLNATPMQPLCFGGNDGSILLSANGGTEPYEYRLVGGTYSSTSLITGLSSDTYAVQVRDANGCETTLNNVIITQPSVVEIQLEGTTLEFCGRADGTATVSASGGTGSLSFSWSNGQSGTMASGLSAGNYNVTVTDENNCVADIQNILITETPAVTLNIVEIQNSLCEEGNGAITVLATNAPGPFTYNWSHDAGLNSPTANGLSSGEYFITVTDGNNCSAEISATVLFRPRPILGVPVVTLAACSGNTGSIEVSIESGGTEPYLYSWSHDTNLNSALASNLVTGTYTCTVTDFYGCTDEVTVFVGELPPPQAMVDVTTATCTLPNGSAEVSIVGGTAPFQYIWSNGAPDSPTAINLAEGDYTVTIIDFFGCQDVQVFSVGNIPGPSALIVDFQNSVCTNGVGNIAIQPIGGTSPFSFNWSHNTFLNQPTAQLLPAGMYSVTVTDANGCTLSTTQAIELEPPPLLTTIEVRNSICTNGNGRIEISASGSGPFVYTWTNGVSTGPVAENLFVGNYRVTVTDINGCITTRQFTIGLEPIPVLLLNQIKNEFCGQSNGSILVTATSGTPPYQYSWSHDTNLNSNFATGLVSGNYGLTLTDANGCTVIRQYTVNETPGPSTLDITFQNSTCNNSNGSIIVIPPGETGSFSYSWSHRPFWNRPFDDNLAPGDYTVTVTDANGCTISATQTILDLPPADLQIIQQINSQCVDGNGLIEINASGSAPFSYTWTNNISTGPVADNLTAGNYSVTVTDANGCISIQNFTILLETVPVIQSVQILDDACEQHIGSIQIEVESDAQPINYNWSHDNDLNNSFASGLTAGTYGVTITDMNNCSIFAQYMVQSVPDLVVTTQNVGNDFCLESVGTITLKVDGGQTPYMYTWSHDPVLNSQIAANLTAGIYSVTVTDINNCTSFIEVEVAGTESPTLFLIETTENPCVSNDVSLTIGIEGSFPPYNYTWSHDSSLNSLIATGLTSGSYSITASDADGCNATLTITVIDQVSPNIEVTTIGNSNCGQMDGSATVLATLGQLPYTFSWSHDLTLNNSTASNLIAGTYTVSVVDANGCLAQVSLNISDVGSALLLIADNQEAICTPDNGSLTIEASNGLPPFVYSWSHSPGLNSPTAFDLPPGSYTITVTDANQCQAVISGTVGFQPPPFVTAFITPAFCFPNTGAIAIEADGTAGPFQINWDDPSLSGFNPTQVNSGTYSASVTDANGCVSVEEVFVDYIPKPSLNVSNSINPSCDLENGSISLSVFGGNLPYVFSWSHDPLNTDNQASNLSAGFYSATVTDGNGCEDQVFVTLEELPFLSLDAEITPTDCGQQNGSIVLIITNGTTPLTFEWSHDSSIAVSEANSLGSGEYIVTVTDNLGCQQISTFNITEFNNLEAVVTGALNPSCNEANGTITIQPTGGQGPYQYQWSHDPLLNSESAFDLAAGPYQIIVTDVLGCQATLQYILQTANNQNISVSTIPQSCPGINDGIALVTINQTGNFTFVWDTPNSSTTNSSGNLPPGSYSVTILEEGGCASNFDFVIEAAQSIEITTSVTPSCLNELNGTATVSAIGGTGNFTYIWSTLQTSASTANLAPGLFTVTVTDSNACAVTANIVVPPAPFPTITLSSILNADCAFTNSGSIEVFATGGTGPINFQWDDPQNQLGPLAINLNPGTYTVTATDENGCTSSLSVDLGAPNDFLLSITAIVQPSCFGTATGSAVALVQGGSGNFSYLWSDPLAQSGPQAINLIAGEYTVTITDNQTGCRQIADIIITDPLPIEIDVINITNLNCFGQNTGSATIQVSGGTGGYVFEWNDPDLQVGSTAQGLSGGVFTVTVTDSNDCISSIDITIEEPDELIIELAAIDSPLCADQENGAATIVVSGGTGPYTYLWNDQTMQNSDNANNLSAGDYTVVVTDANGCESILTVNIPATPPIIGDILEISDPSCAGFMDGSIHVAASGGTGDLNYLWDNGSITSLLSDLEAGVYSLSVSDANGCLYQTSFTLTDPEEISIETIEIIAPTCKNDSDGQIIVNARGGGDLPFVYTWSNGVTGSLINQISGGQLYEVTVTNSNDCSQVLTIDLPPGSEVDISSLTDQATLCAEDIYVLDLSAFSSATVSGPGGFSNSEERVLLENAGIYTIEVRDEQGCQDTVDFQLNFTPDLLVAGMVLPSDVIVGDSVIVLETSWPAPQSVDWIYDETITTLVKQEQNQYWFVFSEIGRTQLTLIARQGGCEDIIAKEIVIHRDSSSIPSIYLGQLQIVNALISPNPSNGPFPDFRKFSRFFL
jgi:hypothetical protein